MVKLWHMLGIILAFTFVLAYQGPNHSVVTGSHELCIPP